MFNDTGTELIIPPPPALAFLSASHLDTGECLNPAARLSLGLDAARTLQGVWFQPCETGAVQPG